MTVVELAVVLALGAVVVMTAVSFAVPWIRREEMRSAIYQVQSHLQLARIEAITRNRSCRFVINTANRTMQVLDTMGTVGNLLDDEQLFDAQLSTRVTFAEPGGGTAVTLTQIGGTDAYQAVFDSDGSVSDGVGAIGLLGGERFGRIAVFGAGGTQVERWSDGAWHVGS